MWLTVNHNTGITSSESVRCSRCIARASELGSYQSNLCNSRGYEWLQKYKDSLKDCFENLNIAMRKIVFVNMQLRLRKIRLRKYPIDLKAYLELCRRMRVKSAWVNSARSYRPLLFSIIRMPVSFWFIKNVQQKFEGIMFGRIYIVSLSILTILAY